MAYVENEPNSYRLAKNAVGTGMIQTTGWHYFPQCRLDHWMNFKEWYDLTLEAEAFAFAGVERKIFNVIPINDNVAIQGNATFTSFNNTIYIMDYVDNNYITDVGSEDFGWGQKTMGNREGFDHTSNNRVELPKYTHPPWMHQNNPYKMWDPLGNCRSIKELRPGKNAVVWGWKPKETNWVSTSMGTMVPWVEGNVFAQNAARVDVAHRTPVPHNPTGYNNSIYANRFAAGTDMPEVYQPQGGPNNRAHRANVNWQGMLLTPTKVKLDLMRERQDPMLFPHTYNAAAPHEHYAPIDCLQVDTERTYGQVMPNHFMKLIPLWSANHNLINTVAQICVEQTIHFEVKPGRRDTALTRDYPDEYLHQAPNWWGPRDVVDQPIDLEDALKIPQWYLSGYNATLNQRMAPGGGGAQDSYMPLVSSDNTADCTMQQSRYAYGFKSPPPAMETRSAAKRKDREDKSRPY